jgi:RNA polymerase sigma-70 factor (ECF subfamily)
VSSQTQQGFVATVERAHGRALRRFLSRRLRHAASDLPDLFQEIFLRLLRIKDHESIRNPQAYLYTVARHVLHQYTLKQASAPETMDPLELVGETPSETSMDPAEEAELQQQITDVGRALEQYSPRAYATLVMYRCEGMTLEEIGARLGVSGPMARKYLIRAIGFCDRYLEERGPL